MRFLLAQLHLDSLVGKSPPKALQIALNKLPTGSNEYDFAYNEAMARTEALFCEKQVLLRITCVKGPLPMLELQHALAVEVGELEFRDQRKVST
jgi:hypothetical protein